MNRKILVTHDGSEGSLRALAVATEQAMLANSELLLAYVVDWSPYSFHTPQELEERHRRRESEIAKADNSVIVLQASALEDSGLHIETVFWHGKIAKTLESLSKEYSRAHATLFGSITAALAQAS